MPNLELQMVKRCFPIGTRVEVVHCDDASSIGASGSVESVDENACIRIKLDNKEPIVIRLGYDLIKLLGN